MRWKMLVMGGVFGFAVVTAPILTTSALVIACCAFGWSQRHQLDVDMATAPVVDGYQDVSIAIEELLQNAGAVVLSFGLLFLPLPIYFVLYGTAQFNDTLFRWQTPILAVPMLVFWIVLHELTHALGWMFFGRLSWRNISFGIDRKTLSPYAHADTLMRADAYRIGAALPFITTGVFPIMLGLWSGDGAMTVLGGFLLSAAVGDFVVLWIIRHIPPDALVLDHPKKAGCLVKIE